MTSAQRSLGVTWALLAFLCACGASKPEGGAAEAGGESAGGGASEPRRTDLPYAVGVESFTPGDGAGFNEDELPDVVLGPPRGKGTGGGSLDVVSLGAGGAIVLGFGPRGIVDREGPDLIVFENPFWPGGDASQVYAELGQVSVSEDGKTWLAFPCDTEGDGEGHFQGCAGVTPTLEYDADALMPLDPAQAGGDAFDLADVRVSHARYVRIEDLRTLEAAGTTSGFDLDAVGLIHFDE